MTWFIEAAKNAGSKNCDACGMPSKKLFPIQGTCGTKPAPDIFGALVCPACDQPDHFADPVRKDALYEAVRARRSSPQPEAGPVVKDVDGVPIRVGDRLFDLGHSDDGCVVAKINDDGTFTVKWDSDGSGGLPKRGNWFRHAPSPAKPPGGEVVPQYCVEHHTYHGGTCQACLIAETRLAKAGGEVEKARSAYEKASAKHARDHQAWLLHDAWAPFALAEVERQAALVARLDFDLRMLKLLGRGYSRNDLLADLARKSKEGR